MFQLVRKIYLLLLLLSLSCEKEKVEFNEAPTLGNFRIDGLINPERLRSGSYYGLDFVAKDDKALDYIRLDLLSSSGDYVGNLLLLDSALGRSYVRFHFFHLNDSLSQFPEIYEFVLTAADRDGANTSLSHKIRVF